MWYIAFIFDVGFTVRSRKDYNLIYGVYDTFEEALQGVKEANEMEA